MLTNPTTHLFWITSRAAGFAALILASLAVSLGLLMSTKLLKRKGPDLIAIHEILSLATIVAIVVHGVTLLGDQYLRASLSDISVPFVSGYKTVMDLARNHRRLDADRCSASRTTPAG